MITLRPLLRAAALSALTLASLAVQAQVSVKEPWVRATVAQQKATGAFMQISSTEPVRLVEAKSTAARIVEIHEMRMEGDRMMMKAIDALDIVPGRTLELKPGSYHVMLIDLKAPLKEGDSVPLTLSFDDGSSKQVDAKVVRPMAAGMAPMSDHKH
jgi:copper(I)-binding protein